MVRYYTVRIPWSERPTVWHPTERSAVLTRGAFTTGADAHAWADAHLAGEPYEVRAVQGSALPVARWWGPRA